MSLCGVPEAQQSNRSMATAKQRESSHVQDDNTVSLTGPLRKTGCDSDCPSVEINQSSHSRVVLWLTAQRP
eukprot:6325088-Amphidinium_carterae.1